VDAWPGIPADRVVAVVAELASGLAQWGSGFLVTGSRVVTAWHCTIDKASASADTPRALSVVRKVDGARAPVVHLVSSPGLDVAVLELGDHSWTEDWDFPRYGRVDRTRAGLLEDCQAIGYPLFQVDTNEKQRNTAELHGIIRRTDEDESGFLLMRDRDLETVSLPGDLTPGRQAQESRSPWGGLSGGLVFHQGYALGIVVEHHPRQGRAAVRILPVDRIATATDVGASDVALALRLSRPGQLPLLTGEPVDAMTELLKGGGTSAGPLGDLAGDPGAPGRNVTSRLLDAATRAPAGDLPFAGRDAELAVLDAWLTDVEGPAYHLVTGNAGMGKTTLLARWSAAQVGRSAGLRVVFVPVSARYEANSELEILHAVLHRLAAIHGVPYARTGEVADYREEVSGLLARPAPEGLTVLLVMDGLDEASDWEPGPKHFPSRLGARVRVLLSARNTRQRASSRDWMEGLELAQDRCMTTELAPLGRDAMASLVGQVRGPAEPGNAELAARLLAVTGGEPLVTSLYLRDLAGDPHPDPQTWPGDSGTVGPGITGYLDRWLKEQRRLWEARDAKRVRQAQRVLSLLALAEGPVEQAHLRMLAGRIGHPMDGDGLRHALELLDRFTLPGTKRSTIVLAHPLIERARRDWLRENGEYDEYARAYTQWADEVLADVLNGSLPGAEVPEYLVRNLAAHLLPTGPDGEVTLTGTMAGAYRLAAPEWRRAQEGASNNLLGYRHGVERVRAVARAANAAAVANGQPAPYLAEQMGCAAALAGERLALSTDMTPELAAELVRHKLWRPGRALDYLAGLSRQSANVVTAMARVATRGDLPALRKILEALVLGQRFPAVWEEVAWATAAFARRVLELNGPQAALEAATWTPRDYSGHDAASIWVLGELIPLLPAPEARLAFAQAIRHLDQFGLRDIGMAPVAHFTSQVPLDLANALWHEEEFEFAAGYSGVRPRYAGPAAFVSRSVLGLDDYHHPGQSLITDRGLDSAGMHVFGNGRPLVEIGPWLDEETLTEALRVMLTAVGELDGESVYLDQVLPDSPYQGLVSIIRPEWAEEVAEYLADRLGPKNRTIFLFQLLPLLSGEVRERYAEKAFEHPEVLDLPLVTVEVIGSAVGRTGYAGKILDAMESGLIESPSLWLTELAPYLTREEAQRALALDRNLVLARLASFSRADAAAVLDGLYRDQDLPQDVVAVLEDPEGSSRHPHAGSDRHAPWGTASFGVPWWEKGMFLGVPWHQETGMLAYRRPPRPGGTTTVPDSTWRELQPSPMSASDAVTLAFEAASSRAEDALPLLLQVNESLDLGPWVALTVLGAGTHLCDGAQRGRLTDFIVEILNDMREAAREDEARFRARRDGLAQDCPWLMLAASEWTPFFLRVLHPSTWPQIKPALFGDGFLDGVERTHSWYQEKEHQRLDDWAHDVLACTQVLSAAELRHVAQVATQWPDSRSSAPDQRGPILSGTTRGWFWAGMAIGYTARGEWEAAAESVGNIGGFEKEKAVEAALTEMGAICDPDGLTNWLALVHQNIEDARARSMLLLRIIENRWPELTPEQCWLAVNQWLSMGTQRASNDVLYEAVAYAGAIERVADRQELPRLLHLIEHGSHLD
jgi:hypothetical protein